MTEETQELSPTLRLLEAVLFATSELVTLSFLNEQLGRGTGVPELLKELQAHYANRGVNLVRNDGIWSFRTAADLASHLKSQSSPSATAPRRWRGFGDHRLSPADHARRNRKHSRRRNQP